VACTLLLRRGGLAGPVIHRQPIANLGISCKQAYHSYHLIQHLGYNGECEVADCCLVVARRENVRFSGKVRDLGPTLHGLAYHDIWKLPQSCHFNIPHTKHNTAEMAARLSVARAVRQLASTAAKRPAPFVCQKWQLQAQKQRLFSVSAACEFMFGEEIVVWGGQGANGWQ
jgi:hypothetical protein